MQTVILAAGRGTRMGPLTESTPKPMLPIADRPLAAHVADAAVDAGATRLVFVVGYRGEAVRSYFGDSYRGVPVEYAEQDEQRGTADAVAAARASLAAEKFAVLNGDVLLDAESLSELFAVDAGIGCTRVEDPTSYGVLAVTDENVVTDVVEKPADPPSDLINAGAYVFPPDALNWLDVPESDRGERELTDVLERCIRELDVRAVPLDEWLDVGRPWELLAANERRIAALDARIDGDVSSDATIEGDVVVEKGATVREGVTIEGPALVRSGASVGPNAYVRGVTLLGEDASVGHAVEVKNSVLRAGATVGHQSYVGDSVLGQDVNFGAGTQVANLRHDDEPVRVTVKGDRVSTGRRKFGVVVGDDVKTGINTSLNAGVTLGSGLWTEPGERVRTDRTE
ncbi:bifunctional sugar-1-phosphate nucleotidylyltransferase/acetyltransferase [Haloparvum sp. PAK95]|uniref:bifunctional sugar-1-phosphate nucleotidylyltransferase/acetyltransferase n=1 Tax=Haloparvum sp. PAK95 TaxID=3418962 RepID=UPI003D2ED586